MNAIADVLRSAVQYHQTGAFQDAERLYWQVLQSDPNQADAWHLLGVLTSQQGRHELAITYIQKALDLHPGTGPFWYNMGLAYKGLDRKADAAACFRQALDWRSDYAPAHNALGSVLLDQRDLEQARSHCQEAVRLNPNLVEGYLNLGNVHVEEDRPAEAVACFDRAIQIKPDYADALVNKGSLLGKLGDLDQSLACLEAALRINPDHAEAHGNRALIYLVHGDFARGWPEYEWRWRCKEKLPEFSQPRWDGSPLGGRTILLYCEQGLGDTLHFIRYADLVKQHGGRVLVQCQAPLLPILKNCSGIDELVPRNAPLPAFDVHAPLLSLPGILHTTLDTIPAQVPYLSAKAELVARWHQELRPFWGFKIGINWRGRPDNPAERYRRFPLAQFAPLARLPGVHLVSLQKEGSEEILHAHADRFRVVDFGPEVDGASGPFMDTAAIMKNLDLVITSDTVIPHLAGALGVPVWVALPVSPDWRWLLGREDSPWYPTMRLFRQEKAGDWHGAFERITAALKILIGAANG
jgi:tetratricopeptide (TPR) repeat protein